VRTDIGGEPYSAHYERDEFGGERAFVSQEPMPPVRPGRDTPPVPIPLPLRSPRRLDTGREFF